MAGPSCRAIACCRGKCSRFSSIIMKHTSEVRVSVEVFEYEVSEEAAD